MKDYKRLTGQEWSKDIDLSQELGYSYIYKRLYELEDKIENGTLAELPFRAGTKVYIAGKISGDERYADKFNQAADCLRVNGYTVINPAILPLGLSKGDYMRICFAMIDSCDIVVALPDAKHSEGARTEIVYCDYIKKPVVTYESIIKNK